MAMYLPSFLMAVALASSAFSGLAAEMNTLRSRETLALRGGLQEDGAAVVLSDDADESISGKEDQEAIAKSSLVAEGKGMSYAAVSIHGHRHTTNGDDKNDEEKDAGKDDDEKDENEDEGKDEEKSDAKKDKGKKDKGKEEEEDSKKGRKGKGGEKKDEGDDSENKTDDGEDEDDEEDSKEVQELEKKMRSAKRDRRQLRAELKSYKDDNGFAKKLSEDVEKVANETQSYALARFLGSLKASQRQFAKANYEEFLEEELEKVNKKIKKLEKKLDQADDDDDDDDKEKTKEEGDDEGRKSTKLEKAMGLPEHQSAGETFALAFFANVAMISIVFAMANAKNDKVKCYTWFLLDQVVAIFLAVMNFQAFDSMLNVSAMGAGSEVTCSIVHTLILLVVVLGAAYKLRKNELLLAVLCGAGAHFVSFSSIHSCSTLQTKIFVAYSKTVVMCTFGLCVLLLGLGMIGFLAHQAKKRLPDADGDGYTDKTDDLENDVFATSFSVVFTMLMRFILTGHHPEDDETEFDHTARQRLYMFIYASCCLTAAMIGVTLLSKVSAESNGSYAKQRICDWASTVLAMNVAWAFLYWGEWEFFEAMFPGDPTKGRVMFAVVVTVLGTFLLFGLTKIPDTFGTRSGGDQEAARKRATRVKKLALTALGLVIAFSWELTFDSAVEQMVEGESHPAFLKVVSCLVMLAIILPVYAFVMKPITKDAPEKLAWATSGDAKEPEPQPASRQVSNSPRRTESSA